MLQDLTGKRLRQWLEMLQGLLKITDPADPNYKLYVKWEEETQQEIAERQQRKETYLKRYGANKNT